MRRFLGSAWRVAILRMGPGSDSRHAGIGLGILLTGVLAALSGGYAAYAAFGSVAAALVAGLLWGALVCTLDRAIVSTSSEQQAFAPGLLRTIPRLALATLVALVIARPLQLRLFEPEIARQIARSRFDAWTRGAADVHARFDEQRSGARRELARLQLELDSARRSLAAYDRDRSAATEGASPAWAASPDAAPTLSRPRARQAAQRRLNALEARSNPMIERHRREIARLRAEEERALAALDRDLPTGDGLLARLDALRALERKSDTVLRANLLILLMFVAIQTAPLLMALLQPRRASDPFEADAASPE